MCGRYLRKSDKQKIAEEFYAKNDISGLSMAPDDYNIAPSTFQPVILHKRDHDRWLSREMTEQLPMDLLRPYESEDMEMVEANQGVGDVKNNYAGLMTNSA